MYIIKRDLFLFFSHYYILNFRINEKIRLFSNFFILIKKYR